MSVKDLIIIILIIAIIGSVLFGTLGNFLGFVNGVIHGVSNGINNDGYVNNGDPISNLTSDSPSSSVVDGSSSSHSDLLGSSDSSSSNHDYEEYQNDYETGMVDSDGNPIYLSVISTNGGQMEPGIYEVYWSANGQINQTKVG